MNRRVRQACVALAGLAVGVVVSAGGVWALESTHDDEGIGGRVTAITTDRQVENPEMRSLDEVKEQEGKELKVGDVLAATTKDEDGHCKMDGPIGVAVTGDLTVSWHFSESCEAIVTEIKPAMSTVDGGIK